MSIDTGGPAFPVPSDVSVSSCRAGMSLRDYFAARAMQAYLNFSLSHCAPATFPPKQLIGFAAMSAYEAADAMLKAREVKS